MRKFYAIMLTILLVLGLAGAAQAAALDITGKLDITGTLNSLGWSWGGDGIIAFSSITFSKTFGDIASASLTVQPEFLYVDNNSNGIYDAGDDAYLATTVTSWDYTYNVTPEFKLSAIYVNGDPIVLTQPISGDWYFGNDTALRGVYTFDGGSIAAYTNAMAPLMFGVVGQYNMDALTLAGYFESVPGTLGGTAALTYKITDNLTLIGEVWDWSSPTYFGGKLAYADDTYTFSVEYDTEYAGANLAASAVVMPDLFKVSGVLGWDGAVDYAQLRGDVTFSDTLTGYVAYDNNYTDNGVTTGDVNVLAGLAWKLDGTNTLKADYDYDLSDPTLNFLALTLSIAF